MEMIMLEYANTKNIKCKYWFVNNDKAQIILDSCDIGKISPDGFLKVLDRLKGCTEPIELIKSIVAGSELHFGGLP